MTPMYRTVCYLTLLACLLVLGLIVAPPAALYETFVWGIIMLGMGGASKSAVQHLANSGVLKRDKK